MYCERRVQKLEEESHNSPKTEVEEVALATYRELPAWVLLGEPGSGKTEALKHEANFLKENGLYLTLAEFLTADQPPKAWQDKTLFLDGLDEIRGGTEQFVIQKIANRLLELGSPQFRLACRAADWRGRSDLDRLKNRSPNQTIAQLSLCPLNREDLKRLLQEKHNYRTESAESFLQKAEQLNVYALLGNPINLDLFVKALKQQTNEDWPHSREEVLRLACLQLLSEENRGQRDLQRGQLPAPDALLNCAGELCALLLLSDKQGIALDQGAENELFPALSSLNMTDPWLAERTLRTRAFVIAGVERLGPRHRSIAEYLGAYWLNTRLSSNTLSQQRLLGLLLGKNNSIVSELRGIAAWVATLNSDIRLPLAEVDPLGFLEYGDVRQLPIATKQYLLDRFMQKAGKLYGFHWQLAESTSAGELASLDMLATFKERLQQYQYTEPSQSVLSALLAMLAHGHYPIPELKDYLLGIVRDARCWPINRSRALDSWLKICDSTEALQLLNEAAKEEIQDSDDEIIGHLLAFVYPCYLRTQDLLIYLRPPRQPNLLGAYWAFWRLHLSEKLPEEDSSVLLDQLATKPNLFEGSEPNSDIRRLAGDVLIRALHAHGDETDDDQLFRWLGVGTNQHGLIRRDPEVQQQICDWLSERPERLKAMIAMAIESDRADSRRRWQRYHQQRLHDARHPDDMASWLLSQIAGAKDTYASAYADYLVQWGNARYNPINITLDQIQTWRQVHPDRAKLLRPLLVCNLPSLQLENASREVREHNRREARRLERTEAILPLMPDIRHGTASIHVYEELAKLWHDRFTDIQGETPLERFEQYCIVGQPLYEASCIGFMLCVTKLDLPSAQEIIRLNKAGLRHRLDLAALTGAQLLWESKNKDFQSLSEQRLASLIAFHGFNTGEQDQHWWLWCLRNRPELTANVLVDYANALLRSGKVHLVGTEVLVGDDNFKAVSKLALPGLLRGFPLRARNHQLHHLVYYIQAAKRTVPEQLEAIAADKLTRTSLLVSQRPHWFAALMMTNPEKYKGDFLRELDHSNQRLRSTCGVLEDLASQDSLNQFSVHLTGQLIERLLGNHTLDFVSGRVQLEHRLGDLMRQLISRLSSDPDPDCTQEIQRLLGLPLQDKLRFHLLNAQENQLLTRRESEYKFLDIEQVSRILLNQPPQNARDLQCLALDVLAQVKSDLKSSNADSFKLFWEKASQNDRSPKRENDCRDALLALIKDKLAPFEVNATPEVDHRGDKRSDIQLSYRNSLSLPIEIKLEHSRDLWNAVREQLMARYAITPESGGRGVFVVFWFRGKVSQSPPGGGSKPKNAKELQQMLQEQLSETEADLIRVVVLDVS